MSETYPFEIPTGNDLVPESSGTQSLGSAVKPFANGYFDNLTVDGAPVVNPSGNYLPLTGGTISGDLNVSSGLTVSGDIITKSISLPNGHPLGGPLVIDDQSNSGPMQVKSYSDLDIFSQNQALNLGNNSSPNTVSIYSNSLNLPNGTINGAGYTLTDGIGIKTNTSGTASIGEPTIPFANGYFDNLYINNKTVARDSKVIVVSTDGTGDATTVGAAITLASALSPSITQNIVIWVNAGTYNEAGALVIPQYVSIVGINMETVFIKPPAAFAGDFITMSPDSNVSFVSIEHDGTTGSRGIVGGDSGLFIDLHKVYIKQFDMGISIENVTLNAEAYWYLEYVSIDCPFGLASTYALSASSDLGGTTYVQVNATDLQQYSTTVNPANAIILQGQDVELVAQGLIINGDDSAFGNGIDIFNGATMKLGNVFISKFLRGITNSNTGAGANISTLATSVTDCTLSIYLYHPNTVGAVFGGYDRSTANFPAGITTLAMDNTNFATFQTGEFYSGPDMNNLTEVATMWAETPTVGLLSGGTLTDGGGLQVDIAAGYGYIDDGQLRKITWGNTNLTLSANDDVYIIINSLGLPNFSVSPVNGNTTLILLGRVVCSPSTITFIEDISMEAHHNGNKIDEYLRDVFGGIVADGLVISSGTGLDLNMTGGEYYYSSHLWEPTDKNPIASWLEMYHTSGFPDASVNTSGIANNTQYDNGTDLTAYTAGYYGKAAIWYAGSSDTIMFLYPQAEYSGLSQVQAAPTPTAPASFSNSIIHLADVILQEGTSTWIEIDDTRPIPSYKAPQVTGGGGGVTVHNQLLGLSADDHTQYLLTNGTRNLGGNMDLGGFDLTNAGLINGVQISGHAAQHLPNGSDPLDTLYTPTDITVASASVGIQNILARADHTHGYAFPTAGDVGAQPSGNYLVSGTTINVSGINSTDGIVAAGNITSSGLFYGSEVGIPLFNQGPRTYYHVTPLAATTVSTMGGSAATVRATLSLPGWVNTMGYMQRIATTTVFGNDAGVQASVLQFAQTSGLSYVGPGGYYSKFRFGIFDNASVLANGGRYFVGMTTQATNVPVNADSPAGDHFGLQYCRASGSARQDTTWQLMTRNNTTTTLSGLSMAPISNCVYDFYINAPAIPIGGGQPYIDYKLENVTSGTSVQGRVTTTLPRLDTPVKPYIGVGTFPSGVANARTLNWSYIYCESQY